MLDNISTGDTIADDPDSLRREKRREWAKAYREQNREKIRARQKDYEAARNPEKRAASQKAWRERNLLSHPDPEKVGAAKAAWAQRNREKIKASDKAWRENNPEKVRERTNTWRALNPEKRRAHQIAYYNIPLPETCERCGAGGLIHRHHPDYTKPLMVECLCPRCHKAVHREINEKAAAQ